MFGFFVDIARFDIVNAFLSGLSSERDEYIFGAFFWRFLLRLYTLKG